MRTDLTDPHTTASQQKCRSSSGSGSTRQSALDATANLRQGHQHNPSSHAAKKSQNGIIEQSRPNNLCFHMLLHQ